MNRRRSPRPGPPPDTIVATVARVLLIMLTTTVVSLAAWAVLPLLWGWDAYTVTSGSMAPLVRPGDVVVAGPAVHPDRLRRGTVVVLAPFRNGGAPVTHRIVDRLTDGSYQTKGDANPVPDSRLSRPDQATTTVTDEMGVAALTLNNSPTLQRPGALRGDPDPSTGFTHASTNPTYGTVTNAAHNITGPMSVAAWTNAAGGSLYRLVFKGTATQNTLNYLLAWDSTGTHMRFLADQPATSSRSTAIQPGAWPRDGLWHFVAGVYDGSLVRLYIDGAQVASAAASGALATTGAALTVSENSGNSLGGDVDEVAVWNRALTATEIGTLYAIGKQ